MQDHNWDCAACGAPCKADGHDPCPRSDTGKCTQTWRCWNHALKKITSGAPSVSIVRTVPPRIAERERRLPSWVQDENGHVGPPKQPSRSWMPNRDWTPSGRIVPRLEPTKPLRPLPKKKALPKAEPIDADLAALIDNEAANADDKLRERIEKGDV